MSMPNENVSEKQAIVFGSFNGSYKEHAESLYKGAIAFFRCTEANAHHLGLAFITDFGTYMKNVDVETRVKLSKANKNGMMGLKRSEVAKAKNVMARPSLSIAYVIQQLDELTEQGMKYAQDGILLKQPLHDWLFQTPTE